MALFTETPTCLSVPILVPKTPASLIIISLSFFNVIYVIQRSVIVIAIKKDTCKATETLLPVFLKK